MIGASPAVRRDRAAKPAQKGDMRAHLRRHVAGARRTSGFAPDASALEEGLAAEYRWLSTYCRCSHDTTTAFAASAVARRSPSRSSAAPARRRPRAAVPAGTLEPDKFLFDKGTEALNKKKWLTAREYFKQVDRNLYRRARIAPDAKLGIGDTYLGEGRREVAASSRSTSSASSSSFYPTNTRADYAQYKLGDGALPADARAAARSDRDARRDRASCRPSCSAIRTAG